MENSSGSSNGSRHDSLDRVLNTQTLAQLQEEWVGQYNANLLQRKHDFLQHWGNEFIPQKAVNDFIVRETEMKSAYDRWVEEQSAMFAALDKVPRTRLPGPGEEELSLIPSDLFTPERDSFLGGKQKSTIASLEKTIGSLKGENQMLNERIQSLDRQYALSLATNDIIEKLQDQLARVESQVGALQASGNSFNQSQQRDTKDFQAGDASKNDMDLLGQSFTGKWALVEKILGVDITTTGPKSGNLLELLHSRLWHLEATLLPPHAHHYRGRQPYQPLTEFVKPGSTAAHRTINYSIPPSQVAPSFPHVMNNGPLQHPPMPFGYAIGNAMQATTGPPPPSFPTTKPRSEPQDVRYQSTQPPRAAHHKVPHPLQNDPSIPKGPKAKTPDIQSQTSSSRVSSAEWPALGEGSSQTRPQSSNSRDGSKQSATKVSKQDAIPRPQSAPYKDGRMSQPAYLKIPVQHQHQLPQQHHHHHHQNPTRHPSTQEGGVSLEAFLQVPGGFDAAPASAPTRKPNPTCDDENCEFC